MTRRERNLWIAYGLFLVVAYAVYWWTHWPGPPVRHELDLSAREPGVWLVAPRD